MTIVDKYIVKGENQTQAAFRDAVRGSEAASAKISSTFKKALGGLSGIVIGRALFSVVKEAIDRADEIGTLAQAFGSTAEELSRLDYVAKQSNTSLQEVTGGLSAMQKNLALAAEDSGKAVKAIQILGLKAGEFAKLPLNTQLTTLAERFKGIENPAERTRIAMQLFGDAGTKLLPVLALGAEGIRKLGLESDATGNTLTTLAVEKLQAVDAATKRWEAALTGLKTNLAIGVTPAVEAFGNALARAVAPKDALIFGMMQTQVIRMEKTMRAFNITLEEGSEEARGFGRMLSLLDRYNRASGPTNPRRGFFAPIIQGADETTKAVKLTKAELEELERFNLQDLTDRQTMNRLQAPMGPGAAEIDAELRSTFDQVTRGNIALRDRTIQINDEVSDDFEETADEASEAWLEAQRGIQRSFADFYRDIGSGNGRDLLKGILDSMRDSWANNLAAMTMDWLDMGEKLKGAGWLGKIFGGGLMKGDEEGEPQTPVQKQARAMVDKFKESAKDPCACFRGATDTLSRALGDSLLKQTMDAKGNVDATGEKVVAGVDGSVMRGSAGIMNTQIQTANYLADTMWTIKGAGSKDNLLGMVFSELSGLFAKGGQLQPGKWGIVGEEGPEAVFGGRTGATIVPFGKMERAALELVREVNFGRGGLPGSTPTVPSTVPGAGFRGLFAGGGHLNPGEWGIAGEEGEPEAVFGGRTGATIVPLLPARNESSRQRSAPPQVTIAPVYNIDARYTTHDAAKELIKALPELFRRNNEALESHIIDGMRRGRYELHY